MTVTLSGNVDPWPVQVWCSRPELQVKPLEEKGKLTITVPAECPAGPVWIRVFNAEGASGLHPFLISSLPEVVETEPNNTIDKAQAISGSSSVVHGKYQSNNDVDVFSVVLKAGQVLVADLESNRTLGSPADPVLQILSAQGFVLEQNDDDQGIDPRIVFKAPQDATYLIRTFAFPAATNSSIVFSGGANWIYRLTLTTGPFLDHVMPLTVTRQAPSEVVAFGANLANDALKLPVPAEASNAVLLTAPQLGNYRILPTIPFSSLVEVEPNSAMQPQTVVTPVGISGVISDPADVDCFSFAAKKGQPLVVKILARSLGSPIDPVLDVYDATGKRLQNVDDKGDNRDPEITWNPPADGQYQVRVHDLHDRGGSRFFYHVDIAPPQPDVVLTVATDNFVVPADKPLEIPVTIDRQAGFKDELEVTVLDLPAGVTAAAVKSAAEGDSAKSVKLSITGNGAAFSGPIRIQALSTTEPKSLRQARFLLNEFNSETDRFWLTTIKKP